MTDAELSRMVNQIAAFFAPYPHDEAVRGVATHIRDFWDPRMRARLAALVAVGGLGLDPLALAGATRAVGHSARGSDAAVG